jgi:hypothetical protein
MIYRVLSLTLTALLLVTSYLFAPSLNLGFSLEPESASYSVKPVDQNMVCPGSLIRSGGASGTEIGRLDRSGTAELNLSAEGEGNIEISSLDENATEVFPSSANRSNLNLQIKEATSLVATERSEDQAQGSEILIASQTQTAALDSLRGFAAASCQQPESEFWLVGGSTIAGREALLILSNPSRIDAVADLRIFTDLGELQVAGLAGISVLRESTTVISLASFAPSVSALAVQVSSQGAKLAGWIQQRAIRGTSAQGVDYISPQVAASTNPVIPGLVVSGAKELVKLAALGDEYQDAGHVLRIFAPEGAIFTAQVISSDPDTFGAVLTGDVPAGTVADFPIEELLNGSYSVYVSSDQPVFAAVRVATANKDVQPRSDFAWLSPAQEITGERVFTVGVESAILTLANSKVSTSRVEVRSLSGGDSSVITIAPQGSVSLPVTAAVLLSSDSSFHAQLTLLRDNGISDIEILDPKNIGSQVSVLFR